MNQKTNTAASILGYAGILFFGLGYAAVPTPESTPVFSAQEIIADKAFPLLTEVEAAEGLRDDLRASLTLKRVGAQQVARVEAALADCDTIACYAEAARWTSEEIEDVGRELALLATKSDHVKDWARRLDTRDAYIDYECNAPELLRRAWQDVALGLNRIIEVYVRGVPPRYRAIDSVSFQLEDTFYQHAIRGALEHSLKTRIEDGAPFFSIALNFALKALDINSRDEAARYEPLTDGINGSAHQRVKEIDWDQYEYSTILLPGQGPVDSKIALDPLAIERGALAAERWHKELAPFIVTSGGHVHPARTRFCEAVEMKKYLTQEQDIPENAVIIEPHARHTTTNLRNVGRIVYRFGFPEDKPLMSVTDRKQSEYILNISDRCIRELGYLPFRDIKKVSDVANAFFTVRNVLQADAFDPLDP